MYTRKINVKRDVKFREFGVETAQSRQPSLVDEFYYREIECSITGRKLKRVSHPLYMLFNQQRLDRLGPAALQQWIDSLNNAGNSSLAELKKKCSNDDLLSMVKSRHIQHPCELERYINSLNERAEFFNSEVARIVAEENAKKNEQSTVEKSAETA